jgi:glycosyltransferase involved in cell wall biosynthesis
LDSLGVNVTVFAPGGAAGDLASARFISLPTGERFKLAERVARQLMATPAVGNAIFWSQSALRRQVGILAKTLISIHPDVDVLQGEQQLASMAAIEAGRALGLPVVADLHGVWSEELVDAGSTKRGSRADRNIRTIESAIVKDADHVSVVSPEMREYLVSSLAADSAKVSVVRNGSFPQIPMAPSHPNPRRIVFAGMLSPWQNIGLLVKAVSIVCREMPGVEVFLTGKGELTDTVRRQCRKTGVTARFFWFQDPKRLFQFLASCDVGLLPVNADLSRRLLHPTKLYAYMSVGLPVVTNRSAAWSELVAENEIGIVTDSTPTGFANGILELLRDPDRIQRCGQRALDLLRTSLAYTKEIAKLSAIYSILVDHGRGRPPDARAEQVTQMRSATWK